jgi:hypothetical protein
MQNSTGSLRSQLQHSTAVLDGFISDVNTIKKESSALTKSVNTISKDFLKQCRRAGVSPYLAAPVFQKLNNLKACSQSVHNQANNLKVCLDAVVNNSYKPDLKRADKGKPTRILVQVEQEALTFESHIQLAEDLVASVLPRHEAPFCHGSNQSPDLQSAFNEVKNLDYSDVRLSLQNQSLQGLSMGTLRAATIHLHDQIEAPSVRDRINSIRSSAPGWLSR